MIFSILYISNQKSLIKNQQSFYHLILNLLTLVANWQSILDFGASE